jgi:hypothetical protein
VNNHTFSAVVGALELRSNGSVVVPFPSTSNAIALDAGLASEVAATTGRPANGTGNLTIFGTSHPGLPLAPTPSGRPAVLPDTWAWVRPDLLIGLNPTEGGPIQALLTDVPLDAGLLARLGLTPIDPVGAVAFAHATVADANGPLLFLSVLVGIVIALLVYSTMSLELSERASELQILRSLGTPTRTVAALFGGQAIVLSVLGAALGCALSVVAAHAIIAFASLAGLPNLIILPSPFPAILVGFGVALGAGILASLPPLTRATRSLVTRPEARPS